MPDLSHLLEFEAFVAIHAEFIEALLRHQDALVRGDVDDARREIHQLKADLFEHAQREDDHVLPLLETRGGWGRAGDPRFYREEHDRIRAYLVRFCSDADALDAATPGYARAAGRLIGAEQAFLSLLEHHDDREARCLYPDLIKVTTPTERIALLR
ncbi:MAG: hemerythrin domain-containing protein [Planctomycetes bacterium]|nr:hemerythrin domain-containing protein [Planctomycetota bacterium]